jgi:uncharacterized protein YjbI with pentapeptide repeats
MDLPARPFSQKQNENTIMKRKDLLESSVIIPGVVIIVLLLVIAMSYAFDPADLQKLKTANSCTKCDLSGANLSESHVDNASLTNAGWIGGKKYKSGSIGE